MAAQQPPDGQCRTSPRAVRRDRRGGIARATGVEAAPLPDKGPDRELVATNGQQEQPLHRRHETPPVADQSAGQRFLPWAASCRGKRRSRISRRCPQRAHASPARFSTMAAKAAKMRSACSILATAPRPRDARRTPRTPTTRTTMSMAGKSSRWRKDSLMSRLARLRSTARRSVRLPTIKPSRARPPSAGLAASHSGPRRSRRIGERNTALNSACRANLRSRPKARPVARGPLSEPAVTTTGASMHLRVIEPSDGQASAALGAPGADHPASCLGGHPGTESVPSLAFDDAGLIRPLHLLTRHLLLSQALACSRFSADGGLLVPRGDLSGVAGKCQRNGPRCRKDRSSSRGDVLQWNAATTHGRHGECPTGIVVRMRCAGGGDIVDGIRHVLTTTELSWLVDRLPTSSSTGGLASAPVSARLAFGM